MKQLRKWWRNIVDYINQDPPIIIELRDICDKAEKYECLQKHFPNILARLNAAVERKENAN